MRLLRVETRLLLHFLVVKLQAPLRQSESWAQPWSKGHLSLQSPPQLVPVAVQVTKLMVTVSILVS